MTGTWSEVVTNATCPDCASNGESNRLTHYVTTAPGLSILQQRCHKCHGAHTDLHDLRPQSPSAMHRVQLTGKALVVGIFFGVCLSIGAMAATASALAAMR